MSEAVRIITEQVRLRVRRDRVDLAGDGPLTDQYVRDEVRRCSERAIGGSGTRHDRRALGAEPIDPGGGTPLAGT